MRKSTLIALTGIALATGCGTSATPPGSSQGGAAGAPTAASSGSGGATTGSSSATTSSSTGTSPSTASSSGGCTADSNCSAPTPDCCAGTCLDIGSDPTNCGACGYKCDPNPPHATPACGGGECFAACAAGYADCDTTYANGCEVDVMTDPQNCGTCGHDCSAMGKTSCSNGVCS